MIELLKPFTSAREFVTALFSWGLPLSVAIGVYTVFVFPSIERIAIAREGAQALHRAGIRPWWFLIGLLIVLMVGLSTSSRWIYQLLEGIRWPGLMKARRKNTHRLQWAVLTAELRVREAASRLEFAEQNLAEEQEQLDASANDQERASANNAVATAQKERDDALEQVKDSESALGEAFILRRARPFGGLRRDRPPFFVLYSTRSYPSRSEWIRATRFGNRIAVFETDGIQRYGLDPLAFWYELLVTAPKDLAENIQAARQGVEMWVGTWSAAVLLTIASLVTEILAATVPGGHALIAPLILAVVGWAAASAAYRAASAATDEWRFAVNALVNLGRRPLAAAYGLKMPSSLSEEKLMWEALGGYTIYGTDAYADRLDEFRADPDTDGGKAPQASPTTTEGE